VTTESYSIPKKKARGKKFSLPWPLPPDGYQVEITRWWHPSTAQKNAWRWVYVLRVSIWNPADPDEVEVVIRGERFAESYLSKRRDRWEPVEVGEDVFLESKVLRSKKQPRELLAAFNRVVMAVQSKAAVDERRSIAVCEGAGVL